MKVNESLSYSLLFIFLNLAAKMRNGMEEFQRAAGRLFLSQKATKMPEIIANCKNPERPGKKENYFCDS